MSEEPKIIRRLAAIVVADVAEYSRLMEADEAGTLLALRDRRKSILEPVTREQGGRIVKVMGDGVLIEFASAVNAVKAALELQRKMAEANESLPDNRRIVLRVGVNLGDVIGEGSDIYGDGVNVAARLEALAEPGGILISGKVHDEVRGKVEFSAENLGEISLKNMARAVTAYRLLQRSPAALAGPASKSDRTGIAVLPFVNMSGNPEQDYFADGIAEDLITELSRYRDLAVVARNTTFAYKGKAIDVRSVGRDLGVNFVLEGSVRQSANRVRITAQLIDVETGAHVWAEKFDREIEDIFAVQDEITTTIVSRLAFSIDESSAAQRQRNPTTSASAYTLFLRARAAWRKGDEPTAYSLLREAVKIDPRYGRALGYLAFFIAYGRLSGTTGLGQAEALAEARDCAERALACDKGDAYTLQRVAITYLAIGEPVVAKRYIEAASVILPRDIEIMMVRGLILAFNGQHAEGLSLIERSIRAEPRVPPGYYSALSDAHYLARDYEGSLAALEKIAEPPTFFHLCQAINFAQLDRRAEMMQALTLVPDSFDRAAFARNCASMCRLPEDAEHWREGFRKAGLQD